MDDAKVELRLAELSRKLDILTRLSALTVTKDVKDAAEKMKILTQVGLDHSQIAEILETTSHTVRQRLYEIRKGIREPKKGESTSAK
jgi:DNA-directed RNA polymerase specialized sigma24 family protein